ncbi:MAG TPA: hypothetical protein VGP80_17190 [Gemmatimonadales bacterium]|jgi:hypothetical protein|nr:hypothetical protein [Gemmatimonadales bacterium]
MKVRTIGIGLAVALSAACSHGGPTVAASTQTFTRNVDATPSKVVEATTAVFAERQIPVATTDQTNGKVESIPLDPNAEWGNVPATERVDCGAVAADPNARLVLTMHVKQDNNRSVVSLDAKRDGGASCVLRGPFMTELMDAIVARVAAS